MKKLLIILLLFSMSLHADYEFSFRGGVNVSNYEFIRANEHIDSEYKLGFVFFLSMKKDINDRFYFGLDFGYNQKGGEKIQKATFHTLELPITFGYNFTKNNSMISFYSGVYYSLLIVDETGDSFHWGPIDNDYNLIGDYGFLLGFEYCYNNIIFDFRYQRGFGVLRAMNIESEEDNYDTGKSQFLLMLGYRF